MCYTVSCVFVKKKAFIKRQHLPTVDQLFNHIDLQELSLLKCNVPHPMGDNIILAVFSSSTNCIIFYNIKLNCAFLRATKR